MPKFVDLTDDTPDAELDIAWLSLRDKVRARVVAPADPYVSSVLYQRHRRVRLKRGWSAGNAEPAARKYASRTIAKWRAEDVAWRAAQAEWAQKQLSEP